MKRLALSASCIRPSRKRYDLKRRGLTFFELDASKTLATKLHRQQKLISKFPAIRRDIAVIVDDTVSAEDLVDAVASCVARADSKMSGFLTFTRVQA